MMEHLKVRYQKPEWWHVGVGLVLLLAALWWTDHLIRHPELHSRYSWGAVAAAAGVGLWVMMPFKIEGFWHEVRASIPWLKDPPSDDGHGHG